MNPAALLPTTANVVNETAVRARFEQALDGLRQHHDRFFAGLLVAQWIATIGLALIVSPRTWIGTAAQTHVHVWAAVLLGGAISLFPAWLGLRRSGSTATRHLIAAAQMLMSALLIHLTGGRIETHFHVFGSLAFLAFYRDIRVLVTATVIVYVDHLVRGWFWPESVYGVLVATSWRSVEHAFWVLFEVFFLSLSIRRGLGEMREVARRQLSLEGVNERMEQIVQDRTRALSESEARFRTLFQETPVGLYRASGNGQLQLANPAMLKILGYSSVEEMHHGRAMLQGSIFEPSRVEFYQAVTAKGMVEGQDTVWLRRDGTKATVRESARALRGPDGGILQIDGSAEDVTERRQLEERYTQAQKVQAIGQLAGGIAHDFNNILTAMTGFADLVLSSDTLAENSRRHVTEIRKAGERAAALTRQMLAFGRKQTLQPRVCQLNSVVEDLERMLQRVLGENIHITKDLVADLALVKVDASQIQQVILNLAVNARDAMPNGGRLKIQTTNVSLDASYARLHPDVRPGAYVMLSVSDNGTGIAPEVRARLFEPFFTTKAPGSGTGLGLATCHGIVTQSGGHITIYSEIGLGSTFKVFLPASTQTTEKTSDSPFPSPAERSRGGETVLLVEDDPQVRDLAGEMLSSFGYRVISASNGREALRHCTKANAERIAIIVTDVVMPDIGGRELATKAREIIPGMPVIFTSGFAFDMIQGKDLLEAGFFFLSKPYAMTVLIQKVREALDVPSAQRHPANATR